MRVVKAVLDTNVVVSAHLKGEGQEALILELALSGRVQLVVSEALLEEYVGVLHRPRFDLDPVKIERSIQAIRKAALLVQPHKRLHITRDPDDNKVLECALEAGAEYVVTGNTRHFLKLFQNVKVIPSRQFLEILATLLE
ncbi:MAG: putative toxin-antitoxin system toxin component, PIN family [Acidobacteriia bacterium]|nr:putative toxin-antitoxin system toxin component, PIN family [Terriglobia bacterium]